MNENSLIKDIGRSYIISSFLPAAFFTTIAAVIFRGFLPQYIQNSFLFSNTHVIEQFFLLSLVSTWLGFFLYSSWFWIVRLYEGYLFIKPVQDMFIWFQSKIYDLKFEKYKQFRKLLTKEDISDKEIIDLNRLRAAVEEELPALQISYPQKSEHLLPTRLGNVMRAFEEYAITRYGVDGITAWPRLYQLIPQDMKAQLEERNNQLMFLLNSSFLSLLIGTACLGLNFIRFPCWIYLQVYSRPSGFAQSAYCQFTYGDALQPANFFQKGFQFIQPGEFLLIGIAFLLIAYIIYSISITTAENMGMVVRAGFDLYRLDLLKLLNGKIPSSLKEERFVWDKICENLMVGSSLGTDPYDYEYVFHGEMAKEPEKEETSSRLIIQRTRAKPARKRQ